MAIKYSLRDARKHANLLQSDIAYQLGVDKKTVSRWENNIKGITAFNLKRFCDVCGVGIDEIFLPEE